MFKFLHKQGPIMASSHLYDSMVHNMFMLLFFIKFKAALNGEKKIAKYSLYHLYCVSK